MDDFHSGRAQTLVATDIAARGIHVDDVALVIHADPPVEHKAYLHRSGRTARAGNDGTVVTMMLDDQVRDVRDLTRKAGIKPTTTRVQLGHPLLTELAPGERSYAGGLVREDAPAALGLGFGPRSWPLRPWRVAGGGGRGRGASSTGARKPVRRLTVVVAGCRARAPAAPRAGPPAVVARSRSRRPGRRGPDRRSPGGAGSSVGSGRRGGSSTVYSTSSGGSAASFSAGIRAGGRRSR